MRPLFALAAVLGLAVACSSPTSPSPGTLTRLEPLPAGTNTPVYLGRGTMSAAVDGARWTAVTVNGSTGTFGGSPGVALISGLAAGPAPFTPGLYISISAPLAVGTHTFEASAPLVFALLEGLSSFWSADALRPGGGTVTLTTATAARLTGTFSVIASAHTGTSPSTRTVTNGAFDLSQ